MISRYDKKEISSLWTEQAKFQKFLQAELAVLKALEGDHVPEGVSEKIRSGAKINPERITEIESTVKHDVIAFCTSITENLPEEVAKYFHYGVTSSDIIDTAMTLQIKESMEVILPVWENLLKTLHLRCVELKDVICMGRSHGMFAEPMSFGQKLLGHYNEMVRRFHEFKNFYENELTLQFSGAVGNYTIIQPKHEALAAESLGLKVEPTSTQVIPRDRLAKLVSIGALMGSAIERFAVEIRHLHHSDINELHEGFAKGQKGSSIMPHKKNPIAGENLTGMARMLRSHLSIALDNIVLWHERDISHSSTERMYLPDHFGILYYSITRLSSTIENLQFHKEQIEEKVFGLHTYLSSYYLHHMIKNSSIKREDLYPIAQQAAFETVDKSAEEFHQVIVRLAKEKGIQINLALPDRKQIREIFLSSVDTVFERAEKI